MALLDTTALIELNRGPASRLYASVQRLIRAEVNRGQVVSTSRVNVAELRVGQFIDGSPESAQRIDRTLEALVILEFDDRAAMQFARIKAHLRRIGRPPGDMDVLVAAIAMVNGQTLITHNVRHFADIPGLAVETY